MSSAGSVIRKACAVLAVLGLAAALTGCGVERTVDPVADAATKSVKAGGAKITFDATIQAGAKSYTLSGDGAFDQDAGQMTLDLSQALAAAGAPAGTDGKTTELFLHENGDEVVYVDAPFLSSRLPGGATWVKLDLTKAGTSIGGNLGQLTAPATQNPAQLLDVLRQIGQVDVVGTETIDGVSTTHYHGTIDLAKAAAKAGRGAQAALGALIAQGAPGEVPVDVWIGDDGLVRQFKLSYGMTAGGTPLSLALTFGIGDYGTDVSVTPPPADQVFDVTAFAQLAASAYH